MPSIRDNDLRKSPEYCHYLEAVKDGELTLPDFKIDDNGVPDIHPYEVYCRVKGCLKRTVPSANRNILVKHLKDKNSHGMEFTLHNGPPTMKELMEAKGKSYLDYLACLKALFSQPRLLPRSASELPPSPRTTILRVSRIPTRVKLEMIRTMARALQVIRREGSKAAKSAGEKGTIPCKTCRNAKGKVSAPCGSKPYCEFWRFFSSIDEAKGASMQPHMDNAKETSNEESVLNKENEHENEEEKAAEPEEVQGDGRHVSEHLAITPFAQLNSGEDNSIATNLDLRDFGLNLESI
ncbi:hypothetical protein AN9432.2 [Aspergillus nidulans FGSC A4]|uniref:Uncharacterized protein n=1 Tax=Emericella nidulans (strain FGSC A4 / ATCC 38163 / CBS 112.46 / NRRL 194 / M139) TaxID=227321 RepID=Q5AQJ8_EMENI|nr:hypothetical protein [Aspergillus nidulans FGSC A4]EAA66828.1 hypothetical protein AN9432.2 [Aspergillus nidulans FGSC A4]CBF84587.1 TPA: hypothetical protein ANIA_09432 [Aspergillus nidulans FGSC A4]|eukprot:XP_868814.1 hypothetical protein AN9432.2 [Aspergillus nidulans FGSC A4]